MQEIEPIKVLKSFYPMMLLRKIYLSVNFFSDKGLMNHAASGAFYFLLSIIPMVLLFVFVIDIWLAGYGKISEYFFSLLSRFNPSISKGFFEEIGLLNSDRRTFFGVVGIVGLIWSSRSVFSGIRSTFEIIFNDGFKRGFIADNLISLIFVPVVFVICILFFIASAILKRLQNVFDKFNIPYIADMAILELTTTIFTVFVIFIIAFCLYRFLPTKRPGRTAAISGAILFTVFAVLLQKALNGAIIVASYYLVYGVISTLIVGLFWVYILFALFYLFAEFVYVQQRFTELEFNMYYTRVVQKKGNFIENLLFRSPDTVIRRFQKIYMKDNIIFNEGDKADYIYILRSGSVEMLNGDKVVRSIAVNDIFGERGALTKSQYKQTAKAATNCRVLAVPKSFYDLAAELDPELSQVMLTSLVSGLSDHK